MSLKKIPYKFVNLEVFPKAIDQEDVVQPDYRPEFSVCGPELVSPLGHAVRLVDGDGSDLVQAS